MQQDSSLDALLFRAPPATPIKKGASVEVHPLLEDTFMTIIGSDDAPLVSFRTDKEFNAHKLHCTEEFATSPATECLIIDMAKGLKLKKATGVTVKHVLGAVGKMWEEAVPEYMVDEFLNDCRNKEGVVTWGAAYCERNGWTGWETPRVRKDGEVTIHHNHFDS